MQGGQRGDRRLRRSFAVRRVTGCRGLPARTSCRSRVVNREATYDVEARAIASDIQRQAELDPKLGWGDFALVFRAQTDIEPYLRELRARAIPYEVQADRKYYRRREILDATSLVRAVLDPHDHIALVAVLRSPSVGVPDAALAAALGGRPAKRLFSRLARSQR